MLEPAVSLPEDQVDLRYAAAEPDGIEVSKAAEQGHVLSWHSKLQLPNLLKQEKAH